jgi:hypothetical protein
MRKLTFPYTNKTLVDLQEAGQLAGISPWTLRKDVPNKRIACFRRGGKRGKILISVEDLRAFLMTCRVSKVGESLNRRDNQDLNSSL